MSTILNLCEYNLIKLTERDLINLCQLNNIKSEELTDLYLDDNKLTNIDFIQENTPFINLEILILNGNEKITDISNIKYLKNLRYLGISELQLENEKETVELFKTMKKLKSLRCYYIFKTYTKEQLKNELHNIEIEK